MLLRIAQADAYAVAYEYVKPKDAPTLKDDLLRFERFYQHPTYHKLAPGSYTDDTQMSLAVIRALMSRTPRLLNGMDFAESFYKTFKEDPRDGYSRVFQGILEASTSTVNMLDRLDRNSDKNGAAMRSVPLGAISDVLELKRIAKAQAAITHDTQGGRESSQAVALMSHYALYEEGGFEDMIDWCHPHLPGPFHVFRTPWEGGVGLKGTDIEGWGIGMCTAHAVCTLLTTKTNLLDIMRQVIEWRGDTDSVAAIAWGIASARMKEDVPEFLERDLEKDNPRFNAEYLKLVGREFMRKMGLHVLHALRYRSRGAGRAGSVRGGLPHRCGRPHFLLGRILCRNETLGGHFKPLKSNSPMEKEVPEGWLAFGKHRIQVWSTRSRHDFSVLFVGEEGVHYKYKLPIGRTVMDRKAKEKKNQR